MGIKGLGPFLRKNTNAVRAADISELKGKKVAVDASIYVYKWYMGNYLSSGKQETHHIRNCFLAVSGWLNEDITPVFVFDGAPPAQKAAVMAARAEARENGTGAHVPAEAFTDIQNLLTVMGVETIQAVSEADSTAAELCKQGLVWAVVTDDLDLLTFGTPRVVSFDKGNVTIITLADVLTGLKISMDSFIDFCIMCGCDYVTATLPGIGPVKALGLIQRLHTIEAIIAGRKDAPPAGFTYQTAREGFKNPLVTNVEQLNPPVPDPIALKNILHRAEFKAATVRNRLRRLYQRWVDNKIIEPLQLDAHEDFRKYVDGE